MRRSGGLKDAILFGALSGLVGGLVFGAAMLALGLLPAIASLVRADSPLVGFVVQIILASLIGAGFGLVVWRQRWGPGETLFWGLTYGLLWWVLGALTLQPLALGTSAAWDIHAAQDAFPELLGYLLYGATTGLTLATFESRRNPQLTWVSLRGPIARGALAGLLGAWLLGLMLNAQERLMTMNALLPDMMASHSRIVAWLITLFIGLLAGGIFAWLYPDIFDGSGAGLVRGAVYGFTWWVAGARTLVPVLSGDGLPWSLSATQADFPTLPGYLIFGAALALFYQWLHRLIRLLFADDIGSFDQEGVGTQSLRALGRGIAAGLIGGLLFTLVMIQIGFLPNVADLVGSSSALTGLVVHLAIASLIGMSYGLLFRRQSYDVGSALGWGVSYGFLWWILGAMTLMPLLLGDLPQWTVAAAADAFPALVGHLAYGAGLGITFYLLEARHRPWWVSRTAAENARVARRKEQILTSAPAIWVLVVMIALTLPVLLGM
jgi:uncharacterized membrane protein YagU involved in acid resistance